MATAQVPTGECGQWSEEEVTVHLSKGISFRQEQEEVLPIVTAGVGLASVRLNETSQKEKDKHVYVESKKTNSRQRSGWWLPGGVGDGEIR